MRIASALVLCAALLVAAVAAANPQECENLAREIERYQDMADRAEGHPNPAWQERMEAQVDVLEARQDQRCTDADLTASNTECQSLTSRIEHYEQMAERAEALGNPQWAARAREVADLLAEERSERCPEWSPEAVANRAFMRALKTAGKMALTYFTMGAY